MSGNYLGVRIAACGLLLMALNGLAQAQEGDYTTCLGKQIQMRRGVIMTPDEARAISDRLLEALSSLGKVGAPEQTLVTHYAVQPYDLTVNHQLLALVSSEIDTAFLHGNFATFRTLFQMRSTLKTHLDGLPEILPLCS